MSFSRTTLFACLAGFGLLAAAAAQPATYQIIDTRSQCTAAPVALSLPRIGTTMTIQVPQGFTGSHRGVSLLLTGASNTSAGGIPLPFDMNFQGMVNGEYLSSCGWLLCSGEVVQSGGFGNTVSLPVPNDPRLLGLVFYQQICFQVTGGMWAIGSRSWSLGPLARATIGT